MIPVLSRKEMRAFDAHAIDVAKVPSLVLMENAGRGAAETIERELLGGIAGAQSVVLVCGTGNNGGDAFVVGRHLLRRGALVEAFLVGDEGKLTPDCRANRDAFAGVGGTVSVLAPGASLDALERALQRAAIAVDGLFGTGLDRPITEPLASVIRLLDRSGAAGASRPVVVALDVPSGLDADTGVVMGVAPRADLTVSFAHLKLGHVTGHGARQCGPVHVVDIGVPSNLRPEHSAELVESRDVAALLGKRPIDTHKYRAGHVALLAGSPGKVGAALLAARAALRGGAGAATIVTWPDAAASLEARIFEVMVTALAPERLTASVDEALRGKKALVLGPGFGTGTLAGEVARHVLRTFPGAIVGDADVFSLCAGRPEDFKPAAGRLVLTPHTGELARLLSTTTEAIEADRFAAARTAADRTGAVVLLKGPYTTIAAPGRRVVVTGSGTPALATAGAGDVLAGLVAALACSVEPFEAAYAGAFLHGVSGSAWQKEHADRGLLASEIADGLPGVIGALTSGPPATD